jgi:hypothetical protein
MGFNDEEIVALSGAHTFGAYRSLQCMHRFLQPLLTLCAFLQDELTPIVLESERKKPSLPMAR